MKHIVEIVEKVTPDKLKEISSTLNLKKGTAKNVVSALLNFKGLDQVLASLGENELKMLKLIYSGDDGITFGSIEKELGITVPEIDQISSKMNRLLLAYTTKNRQLLNNKMDKIYRINEISEVINLKESQDIRQIIADIKTSLFDFNPEAKPVKISADENDNKIIRYIIQCGGVSSLDELIEEFSEQVVTKSAASLINKKILILLHNIGGKYCSLFAINPGYVPSAVMAMKPPSSKKVLSVNNRYSMLLNILNAFDTISTFGLFLTKQMEFRKIDRRRITDSLMKTYDFKGEAVDEEKATDIPLFLLNRLRCLKQQKDIAAISLSPLQKELDHPEKLMSRILKSLDTPTPDDKYFPNPFDIEGSRLIHLGIDLFEKIPSAPVRFFYTLLLVILTEEAMKKSINEIISTRESLHRKTEGILDFLTISGIIEIKNGIAGISEAGASMRNMRKNGDDSERASKSIYINPDFTLHIPVKELPSASLYHILAHTEIIKDDVILNTAISKSSIVKAHKRGMQLGKFLEALQNHSKNEIPQNLSFLLTEWSNQAIKLKISSAILMHTNHPTFLDEIQYSKSKSTMIERIAPNYAIVGKDHLDEVLKIARKNDAVISLFEEIDES